MNKQVQAARKRAAEILQGSDASLTLTDSGVNRNGQKYRIYDLTVERKLDDGDIRAIKDCGHQVRLKYKNLAATEETICFFRINGGGIFLVCDYDGMCDFKGAETVWKQFPKMEETKRAGGAAGRFDAASLRNTKSLNTPNTAGGFLSWDAVWHKKLLRTASYTYWNNKGGDEKTWIGATPGMLGRRLKKGQVKSLVEKTPEYKKLKLVELKRRVIVENLMYHLGLWWHGRKQKAKAIEILPVHAEHLCTVTGETHNASACYPHIDGNTTHGIEIMTTWRGNEWRRDPPTCFPLLNLQVTCRSHRDVFFSNLKGDIHLLHFAFRGNLTSWSRLWGPKLIS